MTHQLLQQLHKQLAVETTLVGTVPELSARTDRRSRRDRLSLPGPVNDRWLAALPPGPPVYSVCPKSRLIPKQNSRPVALCLAGQSRIRFLLPTSDCFRVPLVSSLQWLLWRQLQLSQQHTHSRYTQSHCELLLNQYGHDRTRPQTEVKPVLARIPAVDPSKHLPFLRRRQTARTPRPARRLQRLQATSASSCQFHPLVDRRATKPVRRNDRHRIFAFAHALYRHQAYLFESRVIERAAVLFHSAFYHDAQHLCSLL